MSSVPATAWSSGPPADCTFRNDGAAACRYLVVVLRGSHDGCSCPTAITTRARRSIDEGPEWGDGDIYIYFNWKAAHRKAWKPASRDMALFRLEKAEALD